MLKECDRRVHWTGSQLKRIFPGCCHNKKYDSFNMLNCLHLPHKMYGQIDHNLMQKRITEHDNSENRHIIDMLKLTGMTTVPMRNNI